MITGDLGSHPDCSSDLMVSIEHVTIARRRHSLSPLLQGGKNDLYFIENF